MSKETSYVWGYLFLFFIETFLFLSFIVYFLLFINFSAELRLPLFFFSYIYLNYIQIVKMYYFFFFFVIN